jgi:protein O-mannosyl-transferase
MNDSIRNKLVFCLFLGALTFTVFWGVLGNEFINYDDPQYVTDNRHVTSGLSLENVSWAFTSGHAANWHPVTWLSHMVDVELFGVDPRGHHLVNLIFHAVNACLLFLFLHGVTGAPWRSALVAALFAVHPLHLESVAWVAERKDLLSTFLGLLTLLAYAGYARRGGAWRYAVLICCFALGLMAKPMLVTLPLVMLLLDYWPLRRFPDAPAESSGENPSACIRLPFSRLLLEKLPLIALSILSSCVTLYVQSKGEAVHTLEVTPIPFRVANALFAYLRYLGKTVWPADLTVLYPLSHTTPVLQGVLSGIVLLLVSYAVFVPGRSRPYLAVGWLWFLGTLVPVIGIVQVGLQSMADRYTYFPLVGIFVMGVWGAAELSGRRPQLRTPLAVAAALSLLLCSVVTWKNEGYWNNSTALFTHAIAVHPDSYYAQYMLGKALYDDGNFGEALVHYTTARQLNPRFADTYINMGIIQAKQGNQTGAIENFTTALSLKPGSPYVHYNLAAALQGQGRLEEAMKHYGEALRLDPENIGAHFNIGVAFMDLKGWDQAIIHFEQVLRLKPELEEARRNLQICVQQRGSH